MKSLKKIDWSSLWKKEDWLACWVGLLIVFLCTPILKVMPYVPKIGGWTTLSQAFPNGLVFTAGSLILLFAIVLGVYVIYNVLVNRKRYVDVGGLLLIFGVSFLSILISKQEAVSYWGISYVLWALVFGLIISNVFGIPNWLKGSIATEFFIKVGLVIMGQRILFSIVMKAGFLGMTQALLVVLVVWFVTFWICRRFGMSQQFSSIMATGNSICGVSAAIAAGGAVKGDPKEVSYTVTWVMFIAVILIVIMPPIAKMMHLPTNMAGAWLGGVIDNTGSVIAAGEMMNSRASLDSATMVKLAQNVLIGVAAFFLAIWSTLKLGREGDKPSLIEIWYRFPKFIIGFLVASLLISFIVEPIYGAAAAKSMHSLAKGYRVWFFTMAFVCIGLDTKIKDLITVGGGRPAAAFSISQLFNAFWTLLIVWILWSGVFFTPPILAD